MIIKASQRRQRAVVPGARSVHPAQGAEALTERIAQSDIQEGSCPYIVFDKLFDDDFAAQLSREFPSEDFYSNVSTFDNGGRKNLGRWDPMFFEFLKSAPSWRSFYESANSMDFVGSVLTKFAGHLSALAPSIRTDRARFSSHVFGYETQRQIQREDFLFRHGLNNTFRKILGDQYSVSFSITYANAGYGREIHHDARHKVAVLLYFLNDAEEIGGSGGEFCLYDLNKDRSYYDQVKSPVEECDVELREKFSPKTNRAVMFLNTPYAYHCATPLVNNVAPRKFLYISIARRWDRDAWV